MIFNLPVVLFFIGVTFAVAWYLGKREGVAVGYDQCQYDLLENLEKLAEEEKRKEELDKMEKMITDFIDQIENDQKKED